jgi:hypothetical protein
VVFIRLGPWWVSSQGTADGRDNLTSSSILTVIRSPSHITINILYQLSYKPLKTPWRAWFYRTEFHHLFTHLSPRQVPTKVSEGMLHTTAQPQRHAFSCQAIRTIDSLEAYHEAYIVWCPSINCCSRLFLAGCPISQRLSVSADEIFRISVISQSVENIK